MNTGLSFSTCVACTLLLSFVGSISHGTDPYGVSPPSGKQWTLTFDDEFTRDHSPYTLKSSATNMASGIYMFLSLDNDQTGGNATNPFLVQYVRVWRLDPSGPAVRASATGRHP